MIRPLLSFLIVISATMILSAQSMMEAYEEAIRQSILNGTYEEMGCGNGLRDFPQFDAGRACNSNNGYGTASWQPSSTNGGAVGFDVLNCTVPNTPVSSCGFYRVPLAIVIFENPAHVGTNYLNGSGFATLTDTDINNALTQLNNLYANAKIQFYEAVPRRRVTNPDFYDFYTSFLGSNEPATAPNNSIDDDNETASFDVSGIINLYFVGGLNGDHDASGITGYAPYPPSRDYSIMAYRALFGSTLYHELGHYLGIQHTHNNQLTNDDNAQYPPQGAMNNSDCLTSGDKICDTWPDPNFSGCNNATCVYQTTPSPPCGVLTINPASGTNYGGGVSTILQRNIMSYNSFNNCRQDFSPCQYVKAQDVLLNCRMNLCDTAVARHFNSTVLNNAESPYKEICVGGTIPTFTAKNSCYNWYTVPTGGAPVATATNTFTPTAAQLNVNAAGTTFFYIEEVNKYNLSCRQVLRVVVSPKPGNGFNVADGTSSIVLNGAQTINVNTSGVALDANQIVGWWLTVDNPISSTATNQTTLNTALGSATVGGAVTSSTPSQIFEATTGTPATALSLNLDCSVLNPTRNYFLTPFVSGKKAAIADASCVVNLPISNITVGTAAGKRASLSIGGVPCRPVSPPNSPTFTITVNVTGYTGAANNLLIRIRTNATCALPNAAGGLVAGNGTYTFTQANFPAGFDPATTGLCILVFENAGNPGGMSTGNITASLNITYPGTPAIVFPTVNYTNCLFGTPVQINCPNNIAVSNTAGCNSGSVNGVTGNSWFNVLDGSGRIIAAVNPGANNLGTVTVSVNDMAAVPLDGDGRHYIPRYWNFESSNFGGIATPFPSGNVGIRLYLLDAELSAYNTAAGTTNTAAQLNLTHYAGANEDCNLMNNNYSTAILEQISNAVIASSTYNSASGAGYQLQFNLSHFSEIGASGSTVLLSEATLLQFNSTGNESSVDLFWKTNNVNNVERYDVEHSVNGYVFEKIGEIVVTDPNKKDFTFRHLYPTNGANYYRLKLISANETAYSNVLSQNFELQQTVKLIPNPSKSETTLAFYSAPNISETAVEIYDISGKMVFSQVLTVREGMNYHTLRTDLLPAGIYTVRLGTGAEVTTIRFVKE